jgi:hypothetical protein
MDTIAERFCAFHHLDAARFPSRALWCSLTPQARLIYPLLRLVPGYFDADLELIRSVGRQRHLGDFTLECSDYRAHPQNKHFLRQQLRLRASTRRLRQALAETVAGAAPAAEDLGAATRFPES